MAHIMVSPRPCCLDCSYIHSKVGFNRAVYMSVMLTPPRARLLLLVPGDPEPVWADESGAQLMYAYSRASEARQTVQVASSSSSLQDAAAGVAADLGLAVPDDGEYEELDMLVRTTLRSASVGSLIGGTSATAAAAAAAERDGTSSAAAAGASMTAAAATDDESEGFAYNRDGCVVFTGGSYSLGPELIGAVGLQDDGNWRDSCWTA